MLDADLSNWKFYLEPILLELLNGTLRRERFHAMMKLANVGRFARTIRHLRSSQLLWRGGTPWQETAGTAFHFPRHLMHPVCNSWRVLIPFQPFPCFIGPDRWDKSVNLLAAGDFEHLNQRVRIGRGSPDWMLGPRTQNRLWIVTLHYHYWVHDLAEVVRGGSGESCEAEELLIDYWADWIDRCDLDVPGARELAWNTFAVATRIGWWSRACLLLGRQWFEMRLRFAEKVLQSLWRQAEYVFRHVEWDLRGNHLMRDACGLAWAARLLDDPRSDRWMSRATELALAQIEEQILSDGGHFERSPMYHLQVMEDVQTLALLVEDPEARETLAKAWSRMADFAQWMQHPDGQIPLLNDAAIGAGLTAEQMLQLGSENPALSTDLNSTGAPSGGRYFDATGLVVWQGSRWTVFFDVGEVGPGCQPGHAHADSLAVECSVDGRRLFVDPGAFAYDRGEQRRYDRSTAAHNTVCIDETDSAKCGMCSASADGRDRGMYKLIFRAQAGAQPPDGYDRLSGSPCIGAPVDVGDNGVLGSTTASMAAEPTNKRGYLLDPAWAPPCGRLGTDRRRAARASLHYR
jgi:hypothetical protein